MPASAGARETAPPDARAAGVPGEGPLVLFGGIYDWYDPELLLAAWPEIRGAYPDARLLFFENPNPRDDAAARLRARARARARRSIPDGRSILFSPWLPYAARADLYAAADLLVSIASEGLETELAYRTRLLDAAWGGVPSVSVGGGSLARELAAAGAGVRVRARRGGAGPDASSGLLVGRAAARQRAGAAARAFAAARALEARRGAASRLVRADARVDPGRRRSARRQRGAKRLPSRDGSSVR